MTVKYAGREMQQKNAVKYGDIQLLLNSIPHYLIKKKPHLTFYETFEKFAQMLDGRTFLL
jgi:hypothetical protein